MIKSFLTDIPFPSEELWQRWQYPSLNEQRCPRAIHVTSGRKVGKHALTIPMQFSTEAYNLVLDVFLFQLYIERNVPKCRDPSPPLTSFSTLKIED